MLEKLLSLQSRITRTILFTHLKQSKMRKSNSWSFGKVSVLFLLVFLAVSWSAVASKVKQTYQLEKQAIVKTVSFVSPAPNVTVDEAIVVTAVNAEKQIAVSKASYEAKVLKAPANWRIRIYAKVKEATNAYQPKNQGHIDPGLLNRLVTTLILYRKDTTDPRAVLHLDPGLITISKAIIDINKVPNTALVA